MNSDQITEKFGSYHVAVLHQDGSRRLASLYSEHDQGAICRTLALTLFRQPVPQILSEVDRDIRAGHSIGTTLRGAGLHLSKEPLLEMAGTAGPSFAKLTHGTVPAGTPLHINLYRLNAGPTLDRAEPYAVIAEAHHPEHIAPDPEASTSIPQQVDADGREALEALLAAIGDGEN